MKIRQSHNGYECQRISLLINLYGDYFEVNEVVVDVLQTKVSQLTRKVGENL